MNPVRFWVPGVPAPKGSWQGIPVRTNTGKVTTVLRSDKRLEVWTAAVRLAATQAYSSKPWQTPVLLVGEFRFPRPQAHYWSSKKKQGQLRDTAPFFKESAPDIDKLARAVLDALTGVVYADDRQVAVALWTKRYVVGGEAPGAFIVVMPIAGSSHQSLEAQWHWIVAQVQHAVSNVRQEVIPTSSSERSTGDQTRPLP